MATPAHSSEPGPWSCDLRFAERDRGRRASRGPAVEPPCGRGRIRNVARRRLAALREVMPRIQQDVGDRIPYLARRPQDAKVIATVQDRPGDREGAVDRMREARADRLHPAAESLLAGRLDEEMHVVDLDGVVDNPKVAALAALSEARPKLLNEATSAERRESGAHSHGDVGGRPAGYRRTPEVLDSRPRTRWAARATSRTSPSEATPEQERHLTCGSALHH